MRLFDQHVHSRLSFDSEADPVANVEAALARGLSGLTFAEHFDTHPDDWKTCRYDDEAYSVAIRDLRGRWGRKIAIGKGIEVCYQPDRMDFILDFLAEHEFDMVMLSVHYFGGRALHRKEHWLEVDAAEGTYRYLKDVLEAVLFCRRLHDVLGHLDLVKRYTQRFLGVYDLSPFHGLIDRILQACIAADLTPEINTSSLRQNLSEAMPGDETVTLYAELGGKGMLLGSDAHRPQDIGAGLDRAAEMLRRAGLSVAVFAERKKTFLPVEKVERRTWYGPTRPE